jgi:cation diffusion facilitator CzcD-associated flavoprotein CzcO
MDNERALSESADGRMRVESAVEIETSAAVHRRTAESWLSTFSQALEAQEYDHVARMMHADCYWRDLLTFSWDFKTLQGIDQVKSWLRKTFDPVGACAFRLEGEPTIGSIGGHSKTLEFFFRFETKIAFGRGYVRLVGDLNSSATAKILTILTAMYELKGFPEAKGRNRPREDQRAASQSLENWLDRRRAAREFRDRDPDVIVIGAGQSGLMAAARLGQLNVSTLVVERSERVGDVWRKRYRSLRLHNEICMNHFAYMPFPDTWPVYIPKDKLSDWLEFYADSMELNVWTNTVFLGGEYDKSERRWTVRLSLADGSTRTMRPRHIIMAVGVSGIPSIPKLKGIDDFEGPVLHSSGQSDDLEVKGKSVLVVGAGTSAHDIAQDMHLRGADVTMLQRSSVTVVSLEPSSVRAYELYRKNDGVRLLADTDFMIAAVPYDLLRRLHGPLSRQMAEEDKNLLDGLRKVGFLLDNGEDDTGYFIKLLRYQAGYYINVGASELIIEGKIKLKSGVKIERLTERKAIFSDGSSLDLDVLMLATGYQPLQEAVRAMFGDDVADRVGPIWGIGSDGELRNMYARTPQEGFYVAGGGFPAARVYSQYTAMLIKADLEGLLPSLCAPKTSAAPPCSSPT